MWNTSLSEILHVACREAICLGKIKVLKQYPPSHYFEKYYEKFRKIWKLIKRKHVDLRTIF